MSARGVMVIGAGGVGRVAAMKAAERNGELGDLVIASRTLEKAEAIRADLERRGKRQSAEHGVAAAAVDAKDVSALAASIRQHGSEIVVNCASSHTNLAVMRACLETGAHYLDTSVYEKEEEVNMPAPWYANYEYGLKEDFEKAGLTALLSIGFDPGAVNAFARLLQRDYFDAIETLDILDVNGGDHGRYFATNFNASINLREIMEDVVYWEDGQYRTIPHHSKFIRFDFPNLGQHRLFSVGHDELHSLPRFIEAKRIEFWMGFGERYLQVFATLYRLGLLSSTEIAIGGGKVAPLDMVAACLPDPASLAEGYSGEVCIGVLGRGVKDGRRRQVFAYSTCDHKKCFDDVGSQAISYTTGVPAIAGALCIANGSWNARRMVHVEELDPDPFLKEMAALGIEHRVRDDGGALTPHAPETTDEFGPR